MRPLSPAKPLDVEPPSGQPAGEPEPPGAAGGYQGAAAQEGRSRPTFSSARLRILVWYVLLLSLALMTSLVATRQVLRSDVNRRIDSEISQEIKELATLAASGVDPATGERFADVSALLRTSLAQATPETNVGLVALVDDQPVAHSGPSSGVRLDRDPTLLSLWSGISTTTFGQAGSAGGGLRYAAVPLVVTGQSQRGTLVIAVLSSRDLAEVDRITLLAAETGGAALVVASLVSWLVAGRVLRPVREVTALARSLSESDLQRRIPVRGSDEISELAATFNAMLDRLTGAFAAQRSFVNDAGHELRTPITVIRGHLELLDEDPADRAATLEIVHDELDRMSRMVDDLLMLTRSERTDFLAPDVVELTELTESILAKARTLSPGPWELEQTGTGNLVADRQRLTQAVLELARNAVQHAPAGSLIVLGTAMDSDHARLWVRDHGPGVPAADRDRVFERFSRVATGGRNSDGTGLGLAIVRAIATAHGGRVELTAPPGGGAMFTLVVPREPPFGPDDGELA